MESNMAMESSIFDLSGTHVGFEQFVASKIAMSFLQRRVCKHFSPDFQSYGPGTEPINFHVCTQRSNQLCLITILLVLLIIKFPRVRDWNLINGGRHKRHPEHASLKNQISTRAQYWTWYNFWHKKSSQNLLSLPPRVRIGVCEVFLYLTQNQFTCFCKER